MVKVRIRVGFVVVGDGVFVLQKMIAQHVSEGKPDVSTMGFADFFLDILCSRGSQEENTHVRIKSLSYLDKKKKGLHERISVVTCSSRDNQ